MKLGGGASGWGRYFPNKGSRTLLTSGKAVSILPLGGVFARGTYPGLFLYVNSRGVSVVMRIDAVNLRNLGQHAFAPVTSQQHLPWCIVRP